MHSDIFPQISYILLELFKLFKQFKLVKQTQLFKQSQATQADLSPFSEWVNGRRRRLLFEFSVFKLQRI